ncbi:pectate lyase [Catenovulum sp. 2E275]|uniref:pectate lyase n=1 Tax=Catenovulum sp. 2E275 TaxID=2980497 RepID=UPI0021D1E9C5|nr:pectate lyase [Catenovulum sp. 2E275]MCU4677376.1 pectate lyase [Catenovulum sp. 2E275]
MKKLILSTLLCASLSACQTQPVSYQAINLSGFSDVIKHWNDQNANDQQPRYKLNQIIEIADNILVYQRSNGGWPENKNPLRIMTDDEIKLQQSLKNSKDTSFDNRNVYPQIRYLAEVYQQTGEEKYKQAAIYGLEFILDSQLPNGGFTHSPPSKDGYRAHITIMDDVMAGVLGLLQEIKLGSERFDFLSTQLVNQITQAHDKGDALLLKLQVKIKQAPSIWAGQYHADSLQPVQARAFELASVVSRESVDVVRYLMSDPSPSPEKVNAINHAISWFKSSALTGIDMVKIDAETVQYQYHTSNWDRIMVNDPNANPIWARFYDIETNQPLLANRQGQRVESLAQISRERRTGYDWYGRWPEKLINEEYPRWLIDKKSSH